MTPTTSASTSSSAEMPSLEIIIAAVSAFRQMQAADHAKRLLDFMIAEGFDPAKGGRLALPEYMRDALGIAPAFVHFSRFIDAPVLYRAPPL